MARKLKYLYRFDEFDEDILLVVLFDNDALLQMLLVVFNRFAAPSVSGLFTLGWMCPLKREQARREWENELRLINSL